MTIEKLERVMWRLRTQKKGVKNPSIRQLELAIMMEIGTDLRTYKYTKRALTKLGWIKAHGNRRVCLTNKDLEES